MKIHHLTVDEALHSLRSTADGLAESEVRRRLVEFGANRVEQLRREALVLRFLRGCIHFLALILRVTVGLVIMIVVWPTGDFDFVIANGDAFG